MNGAKEHAPTQLFDHLMFALAVALLLIIIGLGWSNNDLQFNMMFLVTLSLACAIVIAYLPFSAEVNLGGWLRAGGAAGVFAACMWVTIPVASRVIDQKGQGLNDIIARQAAELERREKEVTRLQSTIAELRSTADAAGRDAKAWEIARGNIEGAIASSGSIKKNLEEIAKWTNGSASNWADARSCANYGTNGNKEATAAKETLARMQTQLESAKALTPSASRN